MITKEAQAQILKKVSIGDAGGVPLASYQQPRKPQVSWFRPEDQPIIELLTSILEELKKLNAKH